MSVVSGKQWFQGFDPFDRSWGLERDTAPQEVAVRQYLLGLVADYDRALGRPHPLSYSDAMLGLQRKYGGPPAEEFMVHQNGPA